jgi:hypothetical protein
MADDAAIRGDAEQRIGMLLSQLRERFSTAEAEEVWSFLRVREYGLALETLASILVEEKKRIDPVVVQEIDDIARYMHLEGEAFLGLLHRSANPRHPLPVGS